MRVIIKTRFNASKQKIEKFGDNRYLAYLPFPEDEEANSLLIEILSRYLGAPISRIAFKGFDINKDRVFEVL